MRRNSVRVAVVILLLLLLASGLWHVLRQGPEPKVDPPRPFGELLVPRELSGRFNLKGAAEIIPYCRDKVRPAAYDGILRAHGALWAGEANEWDRVLLAAEALEGIGLVTRVIPGGPPRVAYKDTKWHTVRLDKQAEPELADDPPADGIELDRVLGVRAEDVHQIVPALVIEFDDGKPQRSAGEPQALASWLYQPVVLSAEDGDDGLRYELRVGDRKVLSSNPLAKAQRAVLELTWKFKDKTTVWQRELFDQRNTPGKVPGHAAPRVGDRYALVLSAGPLVPEVLKTRDAMLASAKHTLVKDPIERDLIFLGAKYQVDSDQNTAELIKRTSVEVAWTTPRITVVASEPTAKASKDAKVPPGLSLDALADRVEAKGKKAREFHLARGMANDMIETRVMYEIAKQPVISASTILSRFKSQTPDVPQRRLALIAHEAARVLREEPIGTRVRLRAMPPRGTLADGNAAPTLFVERTADGLTVHGLTAKANGKSAKFADGYEWDEAGRTVFGSETGRLAIAADGVLAQRTKQPHYALDLELLRGWPTDPLPVTPGSVLRYRVVHDKKSYSVNVLVSLKEGEPGGMWFTTPEGKVWVELFPSEGPRIGGVTGRWPDVLSTTPIGPAVESFLAAPGTTAKGQEAKHYVSVANQKRLVPGVKIPLSEPADLIEAERGGRWYAAVFTRDKGLRERRDDKYRVHFLGDVPVKDEWLPAKRWRTLQPVQVTIKGASQLANVLEMKGDQPIVHLCGEPDKAKHTVGKSAVRAVRLVEAELGGKWQAAELVDAKDDKYEVRLLAAEAKSESVPAARVRLLTAPPAKDAYAVVLPAGQLPLVLEYRHGDTTLLLESASPVAVGRVRDGDSGVPLADAPVFRAGKHSVRTAGDGSFALHLDDPLFPQVSFVINNPPASLSGFAHPSVRKRAERRVILMVDASAEMRKGWDADAKEPVPADQQRLGVAKQQIKRVLTQLLGPYDDNRVTLWSYAAPAKHPGALDDPALVTQHVDFGRVERVEPELDKLKPGGAASLAAAFRKLGDLARTKKLADDTIVVLFTSGANDGERSPAKAYKDSKCSLPIHVFGLGIAPDGKADQELLELAARSGGSFRVANAKPPHGFDLRSFHTRGGDLAVHIASPCYVPETLRLPVAQVGLKPLDVPLDHECRCKQKARRLLTIGKKNVGDLAQCEGLSPRARALIEERVSDGAWTVTIPNQRVNVAGVSAYGWFETETETGRLVGRTEDGLHGSIADPSSWPSFDPGKTPGFPQGAQQIPFVVWYEGIVAYTTGSVLAGLSWHRSPGFLSGTPDDFKRFVQANALDFSASWWEEVGSSSAPHLAEYYWSGVCLNFVLQSAALGLPPDGCFRRWGRDLCNRASDAVKDAGPDPVGDALNNLLEDRFGEEKGALVRRAIDLGLGDFANEVNQFWSDGVRQGFDCERFTRKR